MPNVERSCLHCGDKFYTFPSQVKKGRAKFCSVSCGTTSRNLTDNPAWREDVKKKISENHAPVPWLSKYKMNNYKGIEVGDYRKKAFRYYGEKCNRCFNDKDLHVHHINRNRKNNEFENLEVLCSDCHKEEHKYEFKRERCPITGRFLKSNNRKDLA